MTARDLVLAGLRNISHTIRYSLIQSQVPERSGSHFRPRSSCDLELGLYEDTSEGFLPYTEHVAPIRLLNRGGGIAYPKPCTSQ